ncbi:MULTISPECIES: hypothetical protein [Rhizobium/Agrobacterium group]|uniref:Uncharacterized protein n=2 Tax=Neorhizobium TaxID=1525371 RepID=A0ABV0LZ64_9HYPH|nr:MULTISPECIES: hypothetical protein [Rhizobium/Agrobacterium group]KGD87741.1 hypothetical protein JL39_26280 [Rhizobium sp. YS-1r]MCC2612191.1 hypothetical protein [Neorhizobium petrolearium]WGI67341.1 hypothetical protein QEO92_20415 [Neorhizobium petrolearium]
MDEPDFSNYEKRRAEQHEELCRAAATLFCISDRICHLRVCRRYRICVGPMLPSPHQAWAVRAQREIGLSGKACAELPLCIANQEPWAFDIYKKFMNVLQQVRLDSPKMDLILACAENAAMRRLPKKRS